MRTPIFISLFNLFAFVALGQDTTSTQMQDSQEGYKHWTKVKTCLRLSVGLQKSFYAEAGVSGLRYIYNDLGYGSEAYYSALEWTPVILPDKPKNIYGLKTGYEMNLRVVAVGMEGKFQTDTKENDFVLTPKIGIGVIGVLNVFYGYNISLAKNPFDKIGHNQFSIVCNLNKHILKGNKK